MKKFTIQFLISALMMSQYAVAQPFVWTQKANMPGTPRAGAAGFSINSNGYVLSGLTTAPITALNDLWKWNQVTNTWTQKASLPATGRYSASCFSIGTKGYIAVGWTWGPQVPLQELWEYNSSNNTWSQKSNFAGTARYTCSSFVISGIGYIGMGYAPLKNDLWAYDPAANAWTQKANLPSSARQSAAGFTISGKGYIACGNNGANLKELWRYDPVANTWLQRTDIPGVARYACQAFVINGKGYVGGGYSGSTYLTDFYQYNPNNNQWTAVASLPAAGRSGCANFSINGKGYIGCGNANGTYLSELWEFGSAGVTVTATATNVSCNGGSDGTATSVATGPAPFTYNWSNGNTTSVVTNLAAGTYTVTVTGSGGTTGTASVVISQPPPIIVSVIYTGPVCKGQSVTLISLASGGTPPYSYNWDNGAFIGGTYIFNTTTSGFHSVTVTDANGCISSPQSILVELYSPPAAPLTAENSGIGCVPDSIKLTTNAANLLTYQWKRNGVVIAGASDSVYYAKTSGSYKVIVTNQFGCSKVSGIKTVSITNCRTDGLSGSPMVFPNPSDNLFTFDLNAMDDGVITLSIYDLSGRLLKQYGHLSNKTRLAIGEDLLPGTYFVNLEQLSGLSTYRIVKTK